MVVFFGLALARPSGMTSLPYLNHSHSTGGLDRVSLRVSDSEYVRNAPFIHTVTKNRPLHHRLKGDPRGAASHGFARPERPTLRTSM